MRTISWTLFLLTIPIGVARPQEQEPSTRANPTTARSTSLLKLAERVAGKFHFSAAEGDRAVQSTFELRATPLLHWTNATRGEQQGVVYVWTSAGRPAVIGTVFVLIQNGQVERQKIAFHTLAETPITGDYDGTRFWAPEVGLNFRSVAEIPARTRTQRLIQMRNLARRFSVAITYPKSKTATLRLAPQPLFRFGTAGQQTEDGAIFSYSTGGTDPEALLVLKATDDGTLRAWRYAFARFHYWGLEARDGDNVAWKANPIMAMEGNFFNKAKHRNDMYNSFRVDDRFPGGRITFDSVEAK